MSGIMGIACAMTCEGGCGRGSGRAGRRGRGRGRWSWLRSVEVEDNTYCNGPRPIDCG